MMLFSFPFFAVLDYKSLFQVQFGSHQEENLNQMIQSKADQHSWINQKEIFTIQQTTAKCANPTVVEA